MTSKEFKRRIDCYRSLNKACTLFNFGTCPIYRATLCVCNSVTVDYCSFPKIDLFSERDLLDCQYVSFDRFTYSEFKVQFGYFKSFVSRLSAAQLNVLKASHVLDSLLNFELNEASE